VASANTILNALAKGDHIKDFSHAARLFVDNNYELQPRFSNLFHVVFNLTPQAARLFNSVDKMEINMLVKTIDLPTFNIDTQTHNQYNRQVHSQHKLNYNPVTVTFHDDQKDLIRSFLHTYANFYYNDSKHSLGGSSYSTNDRYGGYRSDDFGMSDGNQRFFKDIRVYTMLQKRFAEYTLVNPILTAFGHDSHSYANTSVMQHNMTIQYETVKYATGFVNNINPKGFSDIHYDNTPSPLGVFGGGVGNSIFFQGGLVDAANTVATDLFNGNILGAVIKGGVIFNNTKDLDLGRVLEKDLERAVGSILRGKNPLTDVILPNVFGTDRINTGEPRTGTGAPVDRTFPQSASIIPNTVRSNGNNILSIAFNGVTDFVSSPFNLGNATTVPNTTASPASPARLSDFTSLVGPQTSSVILRQQQINDRIQQLQNQITNDPTNTLLIKERDALIVRRVQETRK
tara:strand:+ start:282 stop:1652 length:1371 start_codon:yes stop_codon:yes gene_type:complete